MDSTFKGKSTTILFLLFHITWFVRERNKYAIHDWRKFETIEIAIPSMMRSNRGTSGKEKFRWHRNTRTVRVQ